MEDAATPQPAERSNSINSIPAATPPANATGSASQTAQDAVDIVAILSSATIGSTSRRRIFNFARHDSTPAPEAGPSSRPTSVSLADEPDSDLESLPELLRRGGPLTPRNNTTVKISSSQKKADGKGKDRAVSVHSHEDSDSDVEFVGYTAAPLKEYTATPQGDYPASQGILNSASRRGAVPEKPFTPRKREGSRRARPSAAHLEGKYGLAEASTSLSPSLAASKPTLNTPAVKADPSRPSASPCQAAECNPQCLGSADNRSISPTNPIDTSCILDAYPQAGLIKTTAFFEDTTTFIHATDSCGTSILPSVYASASASAAWAADSDSEIDELEGSSSPRPTALAEDDAEDRGPLLEMSMDDIRPISQCNSSGGMVPPSLPSLSLHVPAAATGESGSTSPMPRTPPDIVITEMKQSPSASINLNMDIQMDSSNILEYDYSFDEHCSKTMQGFSGEVSHSGLSTDSEEDSEPASPLRRRDVIIISENKSRRERDARQRVRQDLEPDLLFSSADSGTSAEPEKRHRTPIDLTQPPRKTRTRKISDESQALWHRHRDAIVWTGREIDGEFPYKELDLIRKSCKDSHHMDNHNRARFESLVNDQLAQEEPKAPRIRVKDPASNQSCPPFDFVYTNRLVYRDKVPQPTKAPGCGCTDGCRPDSPSCRCLKRQQHWTRKFPQGAGYKQGFAYDAKGRLILPDEIPIVECNSSCGCPADCMNRQVSNGRRYALDLIKTAQKGWGVEAASDRPSIRKGSFLCIYAGEVITWQEAERRGLENDDQANPTSYLFDIDCSFIARTMQAFEQDGFQVIGDAIGDATLPANSSPQAVESQTERFEIKQSLWVSPLSRGKQCADMHGRYTVDAMHFGNVGRFFNHACSPNGTLRAVFCDDSDEFKPILAVFAKKKIYPGEEITISYRGGDVEGASDDHDSSTDEEGHGVNGVLTPRRVAATGARNNKRKKRSWRMQNQGSRRKGKGKNGRRKKAGGNAKQAGRVNPQGPAAPFSVVYAECFCGSINCDGYMFQYSDGSDEAIDV